MTTDAANKNAEAAELDKLRAEIDRLDQELVERIHARSKVAMEVGEVKKRYSDNPVFLRPGREASMLRRAAEKHGDHPFPASSLLRIWREIIPAVTSLEGDLSLAIEDDAGAVARELDFIVGCRRAAEAAAPAAAPTLHRSRQQRSRQPLRLRLVEPLRRYHPLGPVL